MRKKFSGCRALTQFLESKGEGAEVGRFEQEADDIRRVLIDELNQTFITPMDREDIFALSRVIDDVVDHAKNTVKEMEIFGVDTNNHLREMAELLENGAEELVSAMRHLKKNPNVAVTYVLRAKRIENRMNDSYLAALKELFLRRGYPESCSVFERYTGISTGAQTVWMKQPILLTTS